MEQLRLSDWLGWRPDECNASTHSHQLPYGKPGRSLPAMLRRRLDDAGRATCDILAALDPDARFPLVHASRHGDAARTLDMLTSLMQSEALSPTRFSMSVHNAILGVHSIAARHHAPLQALGACGDEFEALLLEAAGYLLEGHEAVVVVFSEGALPDAYQGHTEAPQSPCAVGVRLSLTHGCRLSNGATSAPRRPTPLDVIDWLSGRTGHLEGQQRWHLEEA